ncbi:hypothetical protein AgCh_036410 [Apium graveolens]
MGERSELREIQKLEGHNGKVWSVVWNPVAGTDGTPPILASCGSDNTVRIWKQNPATSAFDYQGNTGRVYKGTTTSCCWTPHGRLLAIASQRTISIWDENENSLEHVLKIEDHKNEVVSVSCDASGNHLATAIGGSIWLLERVGVGYADFDYNESIDKLVGETESVQSVQWHPLDESILFSCGSDDSIQVWEKNIDNGEWVFGQTLDSAEKYNLKPFSSGHSSKVWSISFNATGDKMVTSCEDLSIRVWGAKKEQSGYDYGHWKHLQTLSGYHHQRILSVHWSSNGIIASGAADGAICLFDENLDGSESEPMHKLLLKQDNAHGHNINSVQWSPMGTGLLASASDDGTIKIWKLTSPP